MRAKLLILAGMMVATFNSSALIIGPGSASYSGVDPKNPRASDVEAITQCFNLIELYKQDVAPAMESGQFAASYTTTFSNEPTDPQDADIRYDGSPDPFISPAADCLWLLVKDGVAHDPIWYLVDLSVNGLQWNGIDPLELRGFWPNEGAISHVAIYGRGRNSVPEGGATLLLLGTAFAVLGGARRFLNR